MTSAFKCPLCSQPVQVLKKRRFRPILPKITLETISVEGVDPQPAELVSSAELKMIEESVRNSIKMARKRHVAGEQGLIAFHGRVGGE